MARVQLALYRGPGTIGPAIIMQTVLPTSTERAKLRQFIASLSGVTM